MFTVTSVLGCYDHLRCRMSDIFALRRVSASSMQDFKNCFDAQRKGERASRRPGVMFAMSIHKPLENTAFGPEEIERLVKAYELTLQALGLKDRSDPITQIVAEKIITVGRFRIEDPAEISKLVLKELGTRGR